MTNRLWTRRLGATAIAAGVAVTLTARTNAEMPGVDDDTIRIGMHTSQSGPISVFGLTYEMVARLVFDEVNAAGGINGRKIELIVEDDRGDPGAGVAAVTKLIDRDGVALVYGGPYTPVALAVFPRVVDRGMIYWSPAASTPTLTEPFNRLTFQAQMTLDDQAIPVAKLAASMEPETIAFIRENNEYGEITHDAVVAELDGYGLEVTVEETIDSGAVNATAQIAKIKNAGVDVVLHGGTPKALSHIIREAHKQGLDAPIISFGGGSSDAIFELVTTETPIEYYAVSPLACRLGDACTEEFLAKWNAKYPDTKPIVWTAQGYAAAKLFVEGLRQAGADLDQETLIQIFETMPPFSTPEIPYPLQFTAESHRAVKGGYLDGFKDGVHYFFGDTLKQ